MTSAERELERRARELYQRAAHDLDTATAARLRAARRHALEVAAPGRQRRRWMLPSGALAATLLAAVLGWQPLHHALRPTASAAQPAAATGSDSELPPDPDSTDPAVIENMGFYAWLSEQPDSTPAGSRQHP